MLSSNHTRRKMVKWGRQQPMTQMTKVQISFFTTCSQRDRDVITSGISMQFHLRIFFFLIYFYSSFFHVQLEMLGL